MQQNGSASEPSPAGCLVSSRPPYLSAVPTPSRPFLAVSQVAAPADLEKVSLMFERAEAAPGEGSVTVEQSRLWEGCLLASSAGGQPGAHSWGLGGSTDEEGGASEIPTNRNFRAPMPCPQP